VGGEARDLHLLASVGGSPERPAAARSFRRLWGWISAVRTSGRVWSGA